LPVAIKIIITIAIFAVVACFNVNNKNLGKSIYVYEKDNEKWFTIAKKLFSEGRVHYLMDGDYSENSEIDKLIKSFILSYKT
jgi:hypothetical protein